MQYGTLKKGFLFCTGLTCKKINAHYTYNAAGNGVLQKVEFMVFFFFLTGLWKSSSTKRDSICINDVLKSSRYSHLYCGLQWFTIVPSCALALAVNGKGTFPKAHPPPEAPPPWTSRKTTWFPPANLFRASTLPYHFRVLSQHN